LYDAHSSNKTIYIILSYLSYLDKLNGLIISFAISFFFLHGASYLQQSQSCGNAHSCKRRTLPFWVCWVMHW